MRAITRVGGTLVAALGLFAGQVGAATVAEDLPGRLDVNASLRTRYEVWNFFNPETSKGDNDYDFIGARSLFGLTWNLDKKLTLKVEGQATGLFDMPYGATDPNFGPLGLGAVYRAHNRRASDGSVFLKQAYVDIRDVGIEGLHVRGGRFGFSEGSDALSGDPGIDWIQKFRVSQRLIGSFGWSHVGRSFDGGLIEWKKSPVQLSAAYMMPTQGGFDLAGNKSMDDIELAYAAAHLVQPEFLPNSHARLFYIYYSDQRGLVPVDNRPTPVRQAGGRGISFSTIGGNWTQIVPTPIGAADLLFWGVVQDGRWARQDHEAWAYALEVGFRPDGLPGKPWLRGGVNRGSGDSNPSDGEHKTFHQILPTARIYSLSTFYNLMNSEDYFAQLILKPIAGMVWRTDLHWLALTEKNDRWYFGAGATLEDRQIGFGYGARESKGARSLLTVLETQIAYNWNAHVSTVVYYGHHFGNTVVRRLGQSDDADFGYIEINLSI